MRSLSELMACTSSQTPSSSASYSTSRPTNWDVFLSFRGEDTRYNFTSHLYSALDRHGIRTFMDDPELRSGEVISDALLEAIKESKTYIVVLSENYASSCWCLDELVEILNCHKTMARLVIPVFYKIDPSIVRRQSGRFEQAFEKHEFRFADEMERVENWRLTLRQVANKSGKHIFEKRSEADIINEIVDEILLEINPRALDVAKYPVGLDSHVKSITALLSRGTKGVTKIGIYGMGGVGKTTLAKALFNRLLLGHFEGSCFLANVREISGTLKGLESLQQQLINDVLKSKKVEVSSVDQGTKLIEARICSTKILVVIDDLDDHKQFESLVGPFASGSVVILTTRDEEILDKIEVETKYRYRVSVLKDAESLALFYQHAFGDTEPENTFMKLSKDILRHAGGLPLALEVFGSYLYKRSEVGWKSYIEKLQRIPNSSIQQRLIISLDAVESDDPMLKKMFLDIACFFVGRKKEQVVEIMETYYPYADYNIDILKKRCLLTINDRDELRMHDLLQDMGREIAHNNSPDEPGKHSRLWVSKEICDVLKKHEGTVAIEGIMPDNFDYKDPFNEVSFSMEAFRSMRKLRFLYLKGINLTGKFEQTLEDLRWFRWVQCPLKCLPCDFFPQKLVTLELPYSKMTTMWEVTPFLKNLKTLNMPFSEHLTTTPDFSKLLCLETLNFSGCMRLEEVHISIGSLVRLVSLDLMGCVKLRSLPDTMCNLRELKSLIIGHFYGLEEFLEELGSIEHFYTLEAFPEAYPKELGNIGCFTVFNAHHLNVLELPDSIGCLNACMSIKRLPDLSNLKHLKTVDLSLCSGLIDIQGLEELTSIRELNLFGCSSSLLTKRLFQIYSAFGHEIRIRTGPGKFPDWINQTTSLNLPPNMSHDYLGMILSFRCHRSYSKIAVKTSAGSLWTGCESGSWRMMSYNLLMIIVPRSIFSVTDVDQTIELTSSDARANGIHLLYNPDIRISDEYNSTSVDVDELNLGDSRLLDIFLDIACFFIGWKKQEVVDIMETCYASVNHDIDILTARGLLTINIQDELEMHDRLQRLGRKIARNNSPDEPGKHSRLWLSLDICDVMQNHTGTIAIEGIVRRNVDYKDVLEGKSFITKTFKRMSKLRFLYFKNVNLIGSFEQTLEDLRWLCWDECPLQCLPSEFYPQRLVILELPRSKLRTMWEPNMVPPVFDKLKTLNMSYSRALNITPDFTKLPCLEKLNFECCETLEEVHISVGSLVRLSSLNLHDCRKLETLPHSICNLKALKYLDIGGCSSLNALPVELGNIESLTHLNAQELNVWKLPDSIGRLSKLVELRLGCNKNLETLPNTICNLSTLEILDISGFKRLEILPDQLWKLTRLRELDVGGATRLEKLPDIESIQLAVSLKMLDLSESSLTSLPLGISQLSALEDLDLTNCRNLLSIPELLPNMKWIYASGCTSMKRLPNLANWKQLEELDLADCSGLTVISGLEELTCITVLHLEGCTSSLLAYTLTKHLFQIYFGFGHLIEIYTLDFPDWISGSENSKSGYLLPNGGVSGLSLKFPPNASHNLLGMILCFEGLGLEGNEVDRIDYFVENTTTHFILNGFFNKNDYESLMVIVPISIFPVADGDEEIKLTSYIAGIHGIHLLYKSEDDSTTVDLEDERSSPSDSDSDVNVEEKRSYPSKRLKCF